MFHLAWHHQQSCTSRIRRNLSTSQSMKPGYAQTSTRMSRSYLHVGQLLLGHLWPTQPTIRSQLVLPAAAHLLALPAQSSPVNLAQCAPLVQGNEASLVSRDEELHEQWLQLICLAYISGACLCAKSVHFLGHCQSKDKLPRSLSKWQKGKLHFCATSASWQLPGVPRCLVDCAGCAGS